MARRTLLILLAVGTLFVSTAATHEESPPPDDQNVTNAFCPVTEGERVDPSIFVEYEGSRIYFCCQRCRKQFLEDPAAYIQNVSVLSDSTNGHVHSTEKTSTGALARIVHLFGEFHPVVIHFPIALLISALASEALAAMSKLARFRDASRVLVLLGAPLAALAAAMGWAAARTANYPGELARVLVIHRWLGTATAVAAVLTLILSERRPRGRRPYVVALSVTALLVGITGHFGGTLIFGMEHFSW